MSLGARWRAEGVPAGRFIGVAAAASAVGLAAAGLADFLDSPGDAANPAVVAGAAARSTASFSTLPAVEVQQAHDALHDLGIWCTAQIGARGRSQLDSDVDVILGFARRNPDVRFPIDDETGGTLSLLLVARHSLRTCHPAAAARIDQVLPPDVREGLTPLAPANGR